MVPPMPIDMVEQWYKFQSNPLRSSQVIIQELIWQKNKNELFFLIWLTHKGIIVKYVFIQKWIRQISCNLNKE